MELLNYVVHHAAMERNNNNNKHRDRTMTKRTTEVGDEERGEGKGGFKEDEKHEGNGEGKDGDEEKDAERAS